MEEFTFEKKEHIGEDLYLYGTLTITPRIASFILNKSKDIKYLHRKINSSRVEVYANDMKNDSWDHIPDGRTITLDNKGRVLNGQHRLKAIIVANKSLDMLVFVKNVKSNAKALNIDTGFGRSLSVLLDRPSRYTAVISRLFSFNQIQKVTMARFKRFEDALTTDEAKFLDKMTNANHKGVSAVPKAAFFLAYMRTKNKEIIDLWDKFITYSDAMTSTPKGFIPEHVQTRQVINLYNMIQKDSTDSFTSIKKSTELFKSVAGLVETGRKIRKESFKKEIMDSLASILKERTGDELETITRKRNAEFTEIK